MSARPESITQSLSQESTRTLKTEVICCSASADLLLINLLALKLGYGTSAGDAGEGTSVDSVAVSVVVGSVVVSHLSVHGFGTFGFFGFSVASSVKQMVCLNNFSLKEILWDDALKCAVINLFRIADTVIIMNVKLNS